jgi:hypothetical protein
MMVVICIRDINWGEQNTKKKPAKTPRVGEAYEVEEVKHFGFKLFFRFKGFPAGYWFCSEGFNVLNIDISDLLKDTGVCVPQS